MSNFINLTNRSIIEVSGIDCKSFLQGLITNDINKASKENLIYAAMLNAAGRFLYDFFIFANDEKLDEKPDEKLYLDCALSRRDEIIQKLNFYKLRAQVLIKKNDEIKIFHNFSQSGFVDPRHQNLGFRFYTKENLLNSTSDLSLYNFKRISLKIAQGEEDLTYEKSVILEFDFDNLNAIDYQKGCYVGQELTARTHYLGEVRKKIFHVEISNLKEIEKNTEITCQGNSAGIILSSVFFQSKLHALALIRLTQDQNFSDFKENLQTLGQKIFIVA